MTDNNRKKIAADGGVAISAETVRQSDEKKRQHRSLRQTQVYRDAKNLKYTIVKLSGLAPRRYAKYFDEMLTTISHAKQSLAFGLSSSRNIDERHEDMSYTIVLVEDLTDDADILQHLGVISKSDKKQIKTLAQKIVGQAVRLRDYFEGQGMDTIGKTNH